MLGGAALAGLLPCERERERWKGEMELESASNKVRKKILNTETTLEMP